MALALAVVAEEVRKLQRNHSIHKGKFPDLIEGHPEEAREAVKTWKEHGMVQHGLELGGDLNSALKKIQMSFGGLQIRPADRWRNNEPVRRLFSNRKSHFQTYRDHPGNITPPSRNKLRRSVWWAVPWKRCAKLPTAHQVLRNLRPWPSTPPNLPQAGSRRRSIVLEIRTA